MNKTVDIVVPVHNDNSYIVAALQSLISQKLPSFWACSIYVVDDASDTPIDLSAFYTSQFPINLIRKNTNVGVSRARNLGASAGIGCAIVFIDADCSLANQMILGRLISAYEDGCGLCFGQIHATVSGFWSSYQNDAAVSRAKRFRSGETSSMTSQIFIVDRQLFESVGGFDERYHFGFEDRDLFLSLQKTGATIALDDDALVCHNDDINLISISRKLYACGGLPSETFSSKHPEAYKKMAYSSLDIRYGSVFIRVIAILSNKWFMHLPGLVDRLVGVTYLSYSFKRLLVKLISGLAYLNGSHAYFGQSKKKS